MASANKGRAFGKYADKAPPADPDKAGRPNQNDQPAHLRDCLAPGCPLLGTITSTLVASPNAEWFCRYHHGKPPAAWAGITRKLAAGLDPNRPSDAEREAAAERAAIQAEGA